MVFESLPGRPLTISETSDLEENDRFLMVMPAGIYDLEGADDVLVPAVVLVTETRAVSLGYNMTSGGWTLVYDEDDPADREEVADAAQEARDAVQAWAESTQAWAREGNAGVLLEALED